MSADGVWRTISGRRVFIGNGQTLSEAMKESGKFDNMDWKQFENAKKKGELQSKVYDLEINGEKIGPVLEKYEKQYKYVGIRTQEEPFDLGEVSHNSSVWKSGVETSEKLSGLSATRSNQTSLVSHSDKKEDMLFRRKFGKDSGYYYGSHTAVIVGDAAKPGKDVGEIIISSPKVVHIFK